MPVSSAVVSRPRYLHVNGSEGCDETWAPCVLRRRTNDMARVKRRAYLAGLDGDLQSDQLSYLLLAGNTNLTRVRASTSCLAYRFGGLKASNSRWRKQSAKQSLLGKLSRGRHQSTDLVAFIQTFAATKNPKSTSAHRLPGLGRRSRR